MVKRAEVPDFGVLSGVRVVHASASVAGPFANQLLAEMGADVIWLESSQAPDVSRMRNGASIENERRNMRNLALNIPTDEGKKILFDLLKEADIFIEASKGGQYERWGLTDEVLWEANPKLVIVHISGFGLTGDPSFIPRASYDPIAQAFSGLMVMQGYPGLPPIPAHMLPTDYLTGIMAATAALGALYRAQRTGIGDSIDIAQYEVAFRCQGQKAFEYLNLGIEYEPEGQLNPNSCGWGVYKCKDDKYVYLVCIGVAILKALLPLLDLEFGTEDYPPLQSNVFRNTPAGEEFEKRLVALCESHSAYELEEMLSSKNIPCCRVMEYKDIAEHPHYKARETIVEWPGVEGGRYEGKTLRGTASPLRFKHRPSLIWRGAPPRGLDTEDILADAGYSPEKIKELYDQKVIYRDGK
jgi:L-carnitine CoA-transferase